ncbi:ABC transporter substrate-binding protein [Pseudomonas sp. 5P_3.1_Bac2]|uniref:ABC transporter substrate-binding protein n=1 Tax=Pseudomonas sp. 5P_3.1_Bac2 TaxID=2971617 RepID=UPI0021C7EA3F|nr:ABC transporter substrate-binding protein [Pseudomonas sp. 5P_3.1_Bac2]MCU1716652.1 ABC transporter substrate-binding protein [Pseudomonas sp. 5P_3.1_Bac2]
MKNRFVRALGAIAVPALLGWVSLSASVAQAAVTEIRIAVPDIGAGTNKSGAGVVDVLRQQQIIEKEFAADGIKINWIFFKGAGPVINEAFANKQVDLAYLGDLAAIIGKSNGLDTRLLSAIARNIKYYLAVQPGSPIKNLTDLKGKRVGIFKGTANQLSFDAALASQGLTERDYQVINLDMNAANAALAAKQIDATWGVANVLALNAKGLADIPLSSDDLNGAGSALTALVGSRQFVEENPEILARFIKAQQIAVRWLRDESNREAYIKLVSEQAGYPELLLRKDLDTSKFQEIFSPLLDKEFLAQLQQGVDIASQQRLIRKPFKVEEWVSGQFLDAALRDQEQATSSAAR